jgi:hypothetical protein
MYLPEVLIILLATIHAIAWSMVKPSVRKLILFPGGGRDGVPEKKGDIPNNKGLIPC